MKTYLIALFALSSGMAVGQIPNPNSPQTGNVTTARIGQHLSRVRLPALSPVGFWVVEENVGEQAIVHFYTDNRQKIRTDTLRRKHLNLKNRAVVIRLNKRLNSLIDGQSAPASVADLRP